VEILFIFQDFEQIALALKTEFALNFSSRGSGRPSPPSRLVRHCSRPIWAVFPQKNVH